MSAALFNGILRQHAEATSDLSFQIALEDILGNAPAKEPRDGPSVSYAIGYHGNAPDAPDDTPLHEAFEEGKERGFWEARQKLEAAMKAAERDQ